MKSEGGPKKLPTYTCVTFFKVVKNAFRSSKLFKTFHGVCHIILIDQRCHVVRYGNFS